MTSRTWTALVFTTRTSKEADAVAHELNLYQLKGYIASSTILLTIADPGSETECGVGSGGATINALLYTVEHICARRNYQVLSPDVLSDSDILIIHHGRPYPFGCSSRAFTLLPGNILATDFSELKTNFLQLLDFVTGKLLDNFDHGLWVCSSDMLLRFDAKSVLELTPFPRTGCQDACIVAVSASPSYATRHGIVVSNSEGSVSDILYAAPEAQLSKHVAENGTVSLVSGIVFLSVGVAEQFLTLLSSPALESCTYIGHDTGSHPTPVSLFFDILLAMCSGMTESDFMQRSSLVSRSDTVAAGDYAQEAARKVRMLIWDNMRRFQLTTVLITDVQHIYLSLDLCAHDHLIALQNFIRQKSIHSVLPTNQEPAYNVQAINSRLTENLLSNTASFVNCYLTSLLNVESDVFMCNIDVRMPYFGAEEMSLKSGLCLQSFQVALLKHAAHVPVVFGLSDQLMANITSASATYCNVTWEAFFKTTHINSADLWPDGARTRTIWNAKLFPVLTDSGVPTIEVLFWAFHFAKRPKSSADLDRWRSAWRFSLEDIFNAIDVAGEFKSRRSLFYDILGEKISQKLLQSRDFYFRPYFCSAVVDGEAERLLSVLDTVASSASPGVAARTLALIADLLGAMAKGHGGLRSGPAANAAFSAAFRCFENEDISQGIALMLKERQIWTHRPDLLIRCARHYEGAAQICIRKAVLSAREFISVVPRADLLRDKRDVWWTVECPARIDLSGGWTDTPPIAYENGGLVINAAVLINGTRPIGAKVRKTDHYSITLRGDSGSTLEICDVADLQDFCIPNAPGALLKCCLLFANVADMQDPAPLADQLRVKWGSGFEIVSWSNLPQGSGLGTSSILASAIIAAIWSAIGLMFDNQAIVHAVLCVEQMLTTGGGWQDQVGGVYGGVKAGSSAAQLPLKVEIKSLDISAENIEELNSRLVLIYTGKPRLAKNLLQNVVRNWYAREQSLVSTCSDLKATAKRCREAFEKWDFGTICSCITEYYEQKKRMAAGTEPSSVRAMIDALQPYVCAHSLAGAGGGGFFFCLLRRPEDRKTIQELLPSIEGIKRALIFDAAIDVTGIHFSTQPVV